MDRETHLWKQIKSYLFPKGTWVVLLGSDGVGKSTLLERLVADNNALFPVVVTQHLRPNAILPSLKTTKAGSAVKPHSLPEYSPWKSVAKLIYLVLDYNVGYLLRVRPQLARGALFVFDRYFYDLVVDPVRFRYGGPRWLAEFALHLVPRPDLCFILTAQPEVVMMRKQDLTYGELERQHGAYQLLARKLAFAHHIDASQTQEAVADEVAQIMANERLNRLTTQNA